MMHFPIASCINEAKCDEIQWPTTKEHVTQISKFQGYIGFINGTFIEIRKF
jgi:hypothetical protein